MAVTRIERFEAERVLVVERYDRLAAETGLSRMHQEDLCQALGRPPAEKYQSLGGPTPAGALAPLYEAGPRAPTSYPLVGRVRL